MLPTLCDHKCTPSVLKIHTYVKLGKGLGMRLYTTDLLAKEDQ